MNRSENGQGFVEYALILVLVAIVVIAILSLLGPEIGKVFSETVNILSSFGEDPVPYVNAKDDVFLTSEGREMIFNVAANDYANTPSLDLSSVQVIDGSGPSHGILSHLEDDLFSYKPDGGFTGFDSFRYHIDNTVRSDEAEVLIGVQEYAIAKDDYTGGPYQTFSLRVLDNDYVGVNLAFDSPKIVTGPEAGTAELDADGLGFLYTPPDIGFEGRDIFKYEVCSSRGYCDTAVARIDVYIPRTTAALARTTESLNGAGESNQAEPGSAEYMVEKLDLLRDESVELELTLEEMLPFIGREALAETLEPSLEYAVASGQVALYEHLAAIISATQSGNYEALPDLLADLATQTGSLPADVGLKTMAKFLPHAVGACQMLSDAQVPFQTFAEAREAVVLYGAFEEAAAMDEIWDINEARNEFAGQAQPALAASAETIIEILLESGQPKYVKLAEEMQSELATCGGG
jgi:pilus assembly protein Flp/PilA